jgi:hypothetical protein
MSISDYRPNSFVGKIDEFDYLLRTAVGASAAPNAKIPSGHVFDRL